MSDVDIVVVEEEEVEEDIELELVFDSEIPFAFVVFFLVVVVVAVAEMFAVSLVEESEEKSEDEEEEVVEDEEEAVAGILPVSEDPPSSSCRGIFEFGLLRRITSSNVFDFKIVEKGYEFFTFELKLICTWSEVGLLAMILSHLIDTKEEKASI
jgi:hypothetical protein